MHLRLTQEELYKRGGLLDQMMDLTFEASVLVDRNCKILYYSSGSYQMSGIPPGDMAGKIIGEPSAQLFQRVMDTGTAVVGELIILYGRNCIANVFPICDEKDDVIGVFSFLLYKKLKHLKKIISNNKYAQLNTVDASYDILARMESNYTFKDYIGQSPAIKETLRLCQRASATPHPVLLLGETGTGKELLSHAIHDVQTAGAMVPFIKINCTAIPNDLLESELFGHEKGAFTGATYLKKGKFELASGGTILLDEIGDMDMRLQGKLLRVLEEREFERVGGNTLIPLNARIIASTNRDLQELCRENRFRLDLYYRLNALEVRIPPLRARKEDIPLMVNHFIQESLQPIEFSREAMGLLINYDWPGNARELKNLILRIGIVSDKVRIDYGDLVPYLPICVFDRRESDRREPASKGSEEKRQIEATLIECRYNLSEAARMLSITRATLYNRIRRLGIQVSRQMSV